MTDKELKKLNRAELLEMLLLQTKRVEELEEQWEEREAMLQEKINELEKELQVRRIKIEKAGSIAEAALSLNGIFEAAQKAADHYLENAKEIWYESAKICARKEAELEVLIEEYRKKYYDYGEETDGASEVI